jgi:hypothetical protein
MAQTKDYLKIAKSEYKSADTKSKKLLEKIFDKSEFAPKITDCKSFEDVCAYAKRKPLIDAKWPKWMIAIAQLNFIREVANAGWEPNWGDSNQPKWYAYSKKSTSGSGFSFHGVDSWNANTYAGSRLAFKSSELAEWSGKTFSKQYNDFFSLK